MAFPPAPLPTNRTNATPQEDTHPSDHNALAAGLNDTVGYVQSLGTNVAQNNNQIADLFNRKTRLVVQAQSLVSAAAVNDWTQYGVGQIDLATYTYNLLITVSIGLGSAGGGYLRLVGGLNGVMQPQGEARADSTAAQTMWLVHSFMTQLGPGHYDISAFGLTQNGGSIGPAQCTIIATPA